MWNWFSNASQQKITSILMKTRNLYKLYLFIIKCQWLQILHKENLVWVRRFAWQNKWSLWLLFLGDASRGWTPPRNTCIESGIRWCWILKSAAFYISGRVQPKTRREVHPGNDIEVRAYRPLLLQFLRIS